MIREAKALDRQHTDFSMYMILRGLLRGLSCVALVYGLVYLTAAQPAASALPAPVATATCYQAFANPYLEHGSGWRSYQRQVYVESFTPTTAFRLREDYDADRQSTGDIDAFGQILTVPTSTQSLIIEFDLRFTPGSIGGTDRVSVELWPTDVAGQLVGAAPLAEVSNVERWDDDAWHTATVNIEDNPLLMEQLHGQQVALLLSLYGDDSDPALEVTFRSVRATLCPTQAAPIGAIQGTLTLPATTQPLSDVLLLLHHTAADGTVQTIDTTLSQPDGSYRFEHVAPLSNMASYTVQASDQSGNSAQLQSVRSPPISPFVDGVKLTLALFDLQNVELIAPADGATVLLSAEQPATWTWQARRATDRYQMCLIDPVTSTELCTEPAPATSATLTLADLARSPNFTLHTGQTYSWYVRVIDSGTSSTGISQQARAVTFTGTAPSATLPAPYLPPLASTAVKPWTLMVYLAGDNRLDDPSQQHIPNARFGQQFLHLVQLARQNPALHIVVLLDEPDARGTQFCWLRVDAPIGCAEWGEQNTADPQVLARFIREATTNFPSDRTMLITLGSGHSIVGSLSDISLPDGSAAPRSWMQPTELVQAFTLASLAQPLDVLWLAQPAMGTLETAASLQPYAHTLVASADMLWNVDVFDRVLPDLAASDAPTAARNIVAAYSQTLTLVQPDWTISIAVYDLAHLDDVLPAFTSFSTALADSLTTLHGRNILEQARDSVQVYESSGDGRLDQRADAFVDLRHLAMLLAASDDPAVAHAAADLLTALDADDAGLIIASEQRSGSTDRGSWHMLDNASGLAVYLPHPAAPQADLTALYNQAFGAWASSTGWQNVLAAYADVGISTALDHPQPAPMPLYGNAVVFQTPRVYLPLIGR